MAETFTKAELAGIIAILDKEYSDLWQMYDRQGIDLTDTPIQKHLFSIMRKAAAMSREMEKPHDDLILCDGIETEKPRKVVLSSLYGEQLNDWHTEKPKSRDWYLVTIHGADQVAILLWDPEIREWGENTEYGWCPYSVEAWQYLPEVYHAE